MRKIMWGISILMLVVTAVALQFLPESVPMHYNMAGEIDRWGSKYECLIFPGIVLITSLLWDLLSRYYEKKAKKTADEKESAGARTNAKTIVIVGVANAVAQTILQGFILYSSYMIATMKPEEQTIELPKVALILMGCVFIILGNYMTKTRINHIVGIRIKWSMYNDTTWRKSNLFGAIALILVGVLTIFLSMLLSTYAVTITFSVSMILAVTLIVIYSHKIYLEETRVVGKDDK